jgi:hypothetical protein
MGAKHKKQLSAEFAHNMTFEMENPMVDPPAETSISQMIAMNESEMSEDELTDLTYAFQAADMNGEGQLNIEEFHTMLDVMGCEISYEECQAVIKDVRRDPGALARAVPALASALAALSSAQLSSAQLSSAQLSADTTLLYGFSQRRNSRRGWRPRMKIM